MSYTGRRDQPLPEGGPRLIEGKRDTSVTHPRTSVRKARVACQGPAGGSIEVDDAAAVGDSVDRAQLIATALNRDRIPTAHGGVQWHPSTVRGVLQQP